MRKLLSLGLVFTFAACDGGSTGTDPIDTDDTVIADGGDSVAGATVYTDNCVVCHGADGTGNAPFPDITALVATLSDAEIEDLMANGTGGMPPLPALTATQTTDLIAYLRETFPE